MKIAARSLKGPAHWALAAAAFAALWGFGLPFPAVIAVAALAGLAMPNGGAADPAQAPIRVWRHAGATLACAGALITVVFLVVRATAGPAPFDQVAELFTTAALVTFGGAYAVLPFVADQAVGSYGWLDAEAMLNGLAIAEATPGPLILVNTYAGFFAGWAPDQSARGVATAGLATFYTFAPSFALILAFAPAVERISEIPWARRALAGISAAVVGVILNLALYLAAAAFLPVGWSAPAWPKIVLFILALPAVFWMRIGMVPLIGGGIAAGLALHAAGWM